MQDLRLVGVSEDGANLLLADGDGGRFALAIDDELRSTIRRDRREPASNDGQAKQENPLRPRDVQALIRAGVPLEEIAERAGWSLEKVQRYEGPIRAERDYVSELAQRVQLFGRGEATTLRERADRRLAERGVEAERVIWDSWKSDDTTWTVIVRFPAGGRQREASWLFDPVSRSLRTLDDEARWLGGDEIAAADEDTADAQAGMNRSAARTHRDVKVFDVEAEGGVADAQAPHLGARMNAGERPSGDLTASMRARQASRGRTKPGSTPRARTGQAAALPTPMKPVERAERIDVGTTPPPLPSHPRPDEVSDHDVDSSADQADVSRLPERSSADAASAPRAAENTSADVPGAEQIDEDVQESAPLTGESDTGRRRKTRRTRARVEPVSVRSAIEPDAEVQQDESLFGELPGFHDGGESQDDSERSEMADPADTDQVDVGEPQEGLDNGAEACDDDARAEQVEADNDSATDDAQVAAPREVPSRASQTRKSSRPSVPSWDDIMFGGRGPKR